MEPKDDNPAVQQPAQAAAPPVQPITDLKQILGQLYTNKYAKRFTAAEWQAGLVDHLFKAGLDTAQDLVDMSSSTIPAGKELWQRLQSKIDLAKPLFDLLQLVTPADEPPAKKPRQEDAKVDLDALHAARSFPNNEDKRVAAEDAATLFRRAAGDLADVKLDAGFNPVLKKLSTDFEKTLEANPALAKTNEWEPCAKATSLLSAHTEEGAKLRSDILAGCRLRVPTFKDFDASQQEAAYFMRRGDGSLHQRIVRAVSNRKRPYGNAAEQRRLAAEAQRVAQEAQRAAQHANGQADHQVGFLTVVIRVCFLIVHQA